MTASTGRTGGGYYRAQELASKSDGGNPGFSIAEHITNQIIKNDFEVVFPETNIIVVTILRGIRDTWIKLLLQEGVLVSSFGRDRLRLVTHLDFQNTEIDFVKKIL